MAPSDPDGREKEAANGSAPKSKKKSKREKGSDHEHKVQDDDSKQESSKGFQVPHRKKKVKKAGLSKSADGLLAISDKQPETDRTPDRRKENNGPENSANKKQVKANNSELQLECQADRKQVPPMSKSKDIQQELLIDGSLEKQSKLRKKAEENKTELEPEADGEVAEARKRMKEVRSEELSNQQRSKSKKKANGSKELLGRLDDETFKDRKKRKKTANSEEFLKPENAEDEMEARTEKKAKKKHDPDAKDSGDTDERPKEDSVIEQNEKVEPEAEGTVAEMLNAVEEQNELPMTTELQHSKERKKKNKKPEKKADEQELLRSSEYQASKDRKKRKKNASPGMHLEAENVEPEREATNLARTKKKTKNKNSADAKEAANSGSMDGHSVLELEKKANEKIEPEAEGIVAGSKVAVAEMTTGKAIEKQKTELPMNTELQHSMDRKKRNKEPGKEQSLESSEGQTSKDRKKQKKNVEVKPENAEHEREATNLDELKPRATKKPKKKSDAEAAYSGKTDEEPNPVFETDAERKDLEKEGTIEVPLVKHKKSKGEKKTEGKGANAEPDTGAFKTKTPRKAFQRVDPSRVEFLDPRLEDNSYWAKGGAESGWGAKAQEVLGRVKGRGFRHEKTKKKRGSYRGGVIDGVSYSIKFDQEDD